MKLALGEEQRMIRDAARAVLADASDSAAVRACIDPQSGFDETLWRRISVELGWCATGLSERHGGLGEDVLAQMLLFEQMGEHLLCAPYFATVALAANLLEALGTEAARASWLPAIAEGGRSASAPLPSAPDWRRAADDLRAAPAGDGWRLEGSVGRLPEGARVDALLLLARIDEASPPGLFAVARESEGLRIESRTGFDATRRFAKAHLDAVPAERLDDPARMPMGLERATARARLAIAAEQTGAAQRCLDLTLAHTAERRQFGRTINAFQAVKHRCARMMVAIEAARSAVHGAAAALGAGGDEASALEACMAARVTSDEACFFCAQEAIQLHGGVGFTWEYDPQLYFKRAQASHHWLGTPEALCEALAAALLDAPEAA